MGRADPALASVRGRNTLARLRGAGGGSQARVAALHALARVAGAERAEGPPLPARAEDALRCAVYDAAPSPADALLGFLRQPFPDLRVAAYK